MNELSKILSELNPKFTSLVPYVEEQINILNRTLKSFTGNVFSQDDCLLIAYPDQFNSKQSNPLETLNLYIRDELESEISAVHILPFHPWSSDDGFAPLNYHEVSKEYGNWENFDNYCVPLMADCVFNHLSSESDNFKRAKTGDFRYVNMFHVATEKEFNSHHFQENIQKVTRPRTSDLFTRFKLGEDFYYVLTTFGQIKLIQI